MELFWGQGGAKPGPTTQPSVTLLLERLRNARSQSDRREILLELKEFSTTSQRELGEVGLPLFLRILRSEDARDEEIAEAVLKIMLDVVTDLSEAGEGSSAPSQGLKNTEFVLSDPKNVELLLDLLKSRELWTRLFTIQIVSTLLYNSPARMETCVLGCGAGVTRLIDVLEDPREEIRNELLLVLLKLTQSNQEIQNSIAFQEGFERLVKIMKLEGIEDGSIIVCDCLRIIHNVLRGNTLTQKLFNHGTGLKFVCTIIHEVTQANDVDESRRGSGSGFVAIDSPQTSRIDPSSSWTQTKSECVGTCLDILTELIGVKASSTATATVKPTTAFIPPAGLLELLVTLSFVRLHVDASVRIQAMSIITTLLSASVETQHVFSVLCCAVDTTTSRTGSGTTFNLIPATVLLVRHILYCGTTLCPLESILQPPVSSSSGPSSSSSHSNNPFAAFQDMHGDGNADSAAGFCDDEYDAALAMLTAYLNGNDGGRFGMIGHAITPPPPVAIGLPDDAPTVLVALQLAVSVIASHAEAIITNTHHSNNNSNVSRGDIFSGQSGLLASPYVGRMNAIHQAVAVCRACTVLRSVFGNDATAKEVALRIVPSQSASHTTTTKPPRPLFDVLIGLLPMLLPSASTTTVTSTSSSFTASTTSRLPPTTAQTLVKCALLRLFGQWLIGCPSAVQRFLSDPANLFLFDVACGAVEPSIITTPPHHPGPIVSPLPIIPQLPTLYANIMQSFTVFGASWLIGVCFNNIVIDPPTGSTSSNNKRASKSSASTQLQLPGGITLDRAMLLKMISSRVTVSTLMRHITAFADEIGAVVMIITSNREASSTPQLPSDSSPTVPQQIRPSYVFDSVWQEDVVNTATECQRRIVEVYTSGGSGSGGAPVDTNAMAQYQNMIKEQADTIAKLQRELTEAKTSTEQTQSTSQQVDALSNEKTSLQLTVEELKRQLELERSKHDQELKAALERAQADLEALLSAPQQSFTSPMKPQPVTPQLKPTPLQSLSTASRVCSESVNGDGDRVIQSQQLSQAVQLDTSLNTSACTVDEQVAQEEANAVLELQELRSDHEDLLVLVAMQEFTVKSLEEALLASAGELEVAKAKDKATAMLEEYLTAGGDEDGDEDGNNADVTKPDTNEPAFVTPVRQ